ncbi:MAG TPA: PCYCGC motif-containing (lipo)protein [Vicinamibacterales bacterium]|nr:PCYCGC motif-containing (lipo)protein [Vicinamibacterales bacterium]
MSRKLTPARVTFWVAAAVIAGLAIWAGPWNGIAGDLTAAARTPAPTAATQAQAPAQKPAAEAPGASGPHPQAVLPPLELPKFQLSRPKDEVRKIYQFAAEHPEVLSHIACFCGCERLGHQDNEDCFVKSRGKNGDVTAWQEHGFMCPMCLSIGYDSMKMYEAGIPLSDMREDIDRKYGHTGFSTPTPMPSAGKKGNGGSN